jgi:2-desacetyl-2-hydroxyethyl bacteriochlorophyllide A dehydrogenase
LADLKKRDGTMRTIILDQPGAFRLAETPEPARPGPGEALIEVKRVGVCGTDLHAFAGRQPFFSYPRILGHELGAVVVETGPDVASPQVGDRVAVEPYVACGHCVACRAGRYNCCTTLRVLGVHVDGGMRERIVVPARLLHRSDRLSLEQLALVETLGIGAHAVERSALQPSEWAVVVGVGPIGIGVLQMALARHAKVVAIDLSAARLAFAARLGATATVNAHEQDIAATIAALTDGDMAACVFDATGSPASMERSIELPGHSGRLVCVGLTQARLSFDNPSFHRRELTILASRNSNNAFPSLIRLLEEGAVDVTPWITHRVPLETVPDRFADLTNPDSGTVKALVVL